MTTKINSFNEIDQIINIVIMGCRNRELYLSAKKTTPLCLKAPEIGVKFITSEATVFKHLIFL